VPTWPTGDYLVHGPCAVSAGPGTRNDGQRGKPGGYAIDASKIHRELGWKPAETFDTGIRKTVKWYLDHMGWVENVASGAYREWTNKQHGE